MKQMKIKVEPRIKLNYNSYTAYLPHAFSLAKQNFKQKLYFEVFLNVRRTCDWDSIQLNPALYWKQFKFVRGGAGSGLIRDMNTYLSILGICEYENYKNKLTT